MKTIKTLAILLALLLLTGCAASAQPEAPAESAAITVTDMAGRTVTLDGPATKIVALTAGDCELVYALGAGDALVGRGAYCDWPAEVLDLPSVESGAETNLEQILALDPDVLVTTTMGQTKEQTEALENAGVKVVCSDAETIDGTYEAITLMGAILGKDAEAAALIESMQTTFEALKTEASGKTVYFEVSPLEYGLWAAGKGSFMDEIATLLGVTNIFADVEAWAAVSEEQVLERNPDYIVTVAMYFGEGPTPVEEILSRPGWENVTAVKNGAVLNLSNNELSRPTDRLAQGAQLLHDFFYGE